MPAGRRLQEPRWGGHQAWARRSAGTSRRSFDWDTPCVCPSRPQWPELLFMEQLIARKRALFYDDERLIGTWQVTRTEDGINLRADARDPRSLPRDDSLGRELSP